MLILNLRDGRVLSLALALCITGILCIAFKPEAKAQHSPDRETGKPDAHAPTQHSHRTFVLPSNYSRQVIIKFRDSAIDLSDPNASAKFLNELKKEALWRDLVQQKEFANIQIRDLFTKMSTARMQRLLKRAVHKGQKYRPPNFLTYFGVICPLSANPEIVLKVLRNLPNVDFAYIQGDPILPPSVVLSPGESARQGYLDAAPTQYGIAGGIDARYAWTRSGGDGGGAGGALKFIDLEWGWILNHEDLPQNLPPPISGEIYDEFGHGTGVLGIVSAVNNNMTSGSTNKAYVGVAPNLSSIQVVSPWTWHPELGVYTYSIAQAIDAASSALEAGDVLLLEVQTQPWNGAYGLPVEVEQAEYDAIKTATAVLDIVVIEAAGNGEHDLDIIQLASWNGPLLNKHHPQFRDSGAIIVGAADHLHRTPNTTSVGSRVDCYAWSEEVWTTGYDDASGIPGNPQKSYFGFSGTSAASAIVAGAALSLQGIAQVSLGRRLLPIELQGTLCDPTLGTASADPSMDRIGVMPNLRQLTSNLGDNPVPPKAPSNLRVQ